ncbi:Glutathione S-transferase 7 [Operophtera brumata]|uniref:Glutathione S-transferase 7 n=1 Tax=Operophtera brumata TaxID=104452 RepID=A0A0L7LGG1_OPEBR|nr:Glutathione S-transferase 7 [Operophtera brumata]
MYEVSASERRPSTRLARTPAQVAGAARGDAARWSGAARSGDSLHILRAERKQGAPIERNSDRSMAPIFFDYERTPLGLKKVHIALDVQKWYDDFKKNFPILWEISEGAMKEIQHFAANPPDLTHMVHPIHPIRKITK